MLTVSVVIPTLNSARTLGDCLESISIQDYPKDKVEIIVADAGSTDSTLAILNGFIAFNLQPLTLNIQAVHNKLKTGEAGKAIGLKHSMNDIIAFIDSDNILPDKDWLKRVVEPFNDPEIVASEPIEYTYRPDDGYITRYCALLGMNDPLCLFLGNYYRVSTLTGKWTEMPVREEDRGNYLKIELDKKHLPTIGANGFLIRRAVLLNLFSNFHSPFSVPKLPDYLFDIDVIYELLNTTNSINPNNPTNPIRFAKVKVGIIHIFSGNMRTFIRKQRRRIRDYRYYLKMGVRRYPWKETKKTRLLRFIAYTTILFPLFMQALKGHLKRPDRAWLFHPIACWITLLVYGFETINLLSGATIQDRKTWSQ